MRRLGLVFALACLFDRFGRDCLFRSSILLATFLIRHPIQTKVSDLKGSKEDFKASRTRRYLIEMKNEARKAHCNLSWLYD